MAFYKVIQNNTIVDAGSTFIKISEKSGRLLICGPNRAHFVQSSNEQTLYHDYWLSAVPETFMDYVDASIVIIEEDEYRALKEQLENETEISVETEAEEPVVEAETPEPVPEPMSIADMRIIISAQQQEIEQLKKQIATILENT